MATDGVVLAFIQHLGDEGLPLNGLPAVLAADEERFGKGHAGAATEVCMCVYVWGEMEWCYLKKNTQVVDK